MKIEDIEVFSNDEIKNIVKELRAVKPKMQEYVYKFSDGERNVSDDLKIITNSNLPQSIKDFLLKSYDKNNAGNHTTRINRIYTLMQMVIWRRFVEE